MPGAVKKDDLGEWNGIPLAGPLQRPMRFDIQAAGQHSAERSAAWPVGTDGLLQLPNMVKREGTRRPRRAIEGVDFDPGEFHMHCNTLGRTNSKFGLGSWIELLPQSSKRITEKAFPRRHSLRFWHRA